MKKHNQNVEQMEQRLASFAYKTGHKSLLNDSLQEILKSLPDSQKPANPLIRLLPALLSAAAILIVITMIKGALPAPRQTIQAPEEQMAEIRSLSTFKYLGIREGKAVLGISKGNDKELLLKPGAAILSAKLLTANQDYAVLETENSEQIILYATFGK